MSSAHSLPSRTPHSRTQEAGEGSDSEKEELGAKKHGEVDACVIELDRIAMLRSTMLKDPDVEQLVTNVDESREERCNLMAAISWQDRWCDKPRSSRRRPSGLLRRGRLPNKARSSASPYQPCQ